MNLRNIFKTKKAKEQEFNRTKMKGNKGNLFNSLFMSAVVISVITFTLKPDSMTNDNALMIEKINKTIEQKEIKKQKEVNDTATRDFYIEKLRQKGLNRHQIKMHIKNLSNDQKRRKGFKVEEVKTDYSKDIIELKNKQERYRKMERNTNNKRKSPNFS